MKLLHRLLCSNWNNKTLLQVAEDFRKIGTYILGIAFLTLVTKNDSMPIGVSFYAIIRGGTFWITGILLTKNCNNSTKDK